MAPPPNPLIRKLKESEEAEGKAQTSKCVGLHTPREPPFSQGEAQNNKLARTEKICPKVIMNLAKNPRSCH